MRAQKDVVAEVEGVLRRPRWVLGRVVERGEVVVLVLDLRPLQDREAEPDEDVLELPADLGDQVEMPGRQGRIAGQRDVDPILGQPRIELLRLEPLRALRQQGLEGPLDLVGLLPDRAALVVRQVADRAEGLRELCLATQIADAHLLQLARAAGSGNGGFGLPAEVIEAGVRHRRPSYWRARTAPRRQRTPH
jgi:hypothetical protein